MYIIIDGDYKITQARRLSRKVREAARGGELSVISIKSMKGMNAADCPEYPDTWSDIPKHK